MSSKQLAWIDARDVIALHTRLLEQHGGFPGLRDRALLESALARPRQHYSYSENADIIQMASLYAAGIIRNHPFMDGNKRTGFIAGILFLELNGFEFVAAEEDVIATVFALAAGELDEAGYADWLRSNTKRQRRIKRP